MPDASTASPTNTDWVVSASVAAGRIAGGDITVLDTRSKKAFARGHVSGAVRVDWTEFSQSRDPNRGKLLPGPALQKALQSAGVRTARPVLVVGDPPNDWGEDGRIVWMLRYAGHSDVALVDGGIDALRRAGVKLTKRPTPTSIGDFQVSWNRELGAVRDDLRKEDTLILDARERREFEGATPYGESRGGHVPGARSLYFKELMKADGTHQSVESIRRRMTELGASFDSDIIVYCTGGVRSGWLVAVLRQAGFVRARNYPGSMWDWAAAPPSSYPLVRQ